MVCSCQAARHTCVLFTFGDKNKIMGLIDKVLDWVSAWEIRFSPENVWKQHFYQFNSGRDLPPAPAEMLTEQHGLQALRHRAPMGQDTYCCPNSFCWQFSQAHPIGADRQDQATTSAVLPASHLLSPDMLLIPCTRFSLPHWRCPGKVCSQCSAMAGHIPGTWLHSRISCIYTKHPWPCADGR